MASSKRRRILNKSTSQELSISLRSTLRQAIATLKMKPNIEHIKSNSDPGIIFPSAHTTPIPTLKSKIAPVTPLSPGTPIEFSKLMSNENLKKYKNTSDQTYFMKFAKLEPSLKKIPSSTVMQTTELEINEMLKKHTIKNEPKSESIFVVSEDTYFAITSDTKSEYEQYEEKQRNGNDSSTSNSEEELELTTPQELLLKNGQQLKSDDDELQNMMEEKRAEFTSIADLIAKTRDASEFSSTRGTVSVRMNAFINDIKEDVLVTDEIFRTRNIPSVPKALTFASSMEQTNIFDCAKIIFDNFISHDAKYQINISHYARKRLIEIFSKHLIAVREEREKDKRRRRKKNEPLTVLKNRDSEPKFFKNRMFHGYTIDMKVFDEAFDEIWQLLSSSYYRFSTTIEFNVYCIAFSSNIK